MINIRSLLRTAIELTSDCSHNPFTDKEYNAMNKFQTI